MFTRFSESRGAGSPDVTGFYHEDTGSAQFVVSDPANGDAALIDVVQDFDPAAAAISLANADAILAHVADKGLTVKWVLDTHPHADHLMASSYLKEKTGAPNAIGAKVAEIAELWRDIYHMPEAFDVSADFDHLFNDGDTFRIGGLDVRVMLSPGHTLGSITYVIGDAAFVHDTFMHVDVGTARADFPGGSASELYQSLQRILDLPDQTRLFIGHDYPPVDDREDPAWEATVAEHRENNPHLGGGTSEAEFVKLREERDATLSLPDRMLHVLQLNLRAGSVPGAESDGRAYLKIPLNYFEGAKSDED